jgi:hypothetical protein
MLLDYLLLCKLGSWLLLWPWFSLGGHFGVSAVFTIFAKICQRCLSEFFEKKMYEDDPHRAK